MTLPRAMLLLSLSFVVAPSLRAAGPSQWNLETGVSYQTWSSDLDRQGHEVLAPLGMGFQTADGRLKTRFDTAFASGDYRRKDLGLGGSDFSASKLTDSTLGLTLALPGRTHGSLAVNANLPTGDKSWELRQSEGNLPLVLSPTRYRGRAFGLSVLGGLGRDLGAWSVSAALGYFYTGTKTLDALGEDVDLGNYAIAGLSLAKGKAFRVRVFQSLAQNTKLGGVTSYRAPSATVLDSRFQSGGKARFSLEAEVSLFGKAERTDLVTGALTPETQGSFGTRIAFSPALDYGWGPRVELRTGALFKEVLANSYSASDPLYQGGGTELGASQDIRWKTSPHVSLQGHVEYRNLVNRDAGVTADLQLADVTYQVFSIGTGVAFQW